MIDEKLRRAIQKFDLEAYITARFDRIRTTGSSELRVNCFSPNGCNGSDSKQHLWINTEKKVWNCFKCGYGNAKEQLGTSFLPKFISDAENIPLKIAIERVLSTHEYTAEDDLETILDRMLNGGDEVNEPEEKEINLPKQFYQLGPASGIVSESYKTYAIKRGFSNNHQLLYDVRFCASRVPILSYKYQLHFANRVIWPIYDQSGICRSVVARDVATQKSSWEKPRWVNWPDTNLANYFWPLGRMINGNFQPSIPRTGRIVLTEGIVDAHAIRCFSNRISFACFGKKLSNSQIELLHENKIKEIILAWDLEAKQKMIKVLDRLVGRFIVKVFPFQNKCWKQGFDLGDAFNYPLIQNIIQTEINNSIDVESNDFCSWVIQ